MAEALSIHPFMLSCWKQEYRDGKLHGEAHSGLKAVQDMELAVAEHKKIRALEAVLKHYIRFYNHRLHSGIAYHTPEEYERLYR